MCGFFDTRVHRHPPKFIIMVDSKVEKNDKSFRGRVAEWSKALVLGTSHFYGVGSNPTPAIFFLLPNILAKFGANMTITVLHFCPPSSLSIFSSLFVFLLPLCLYSLPLSFSFM